MSFGFNGRPIIGLGKWAIHHLLIGELYSNDATGIANEERDERN